MALRPSFAGAWMPAQGASQFRNRPQLREILRAGCVVVAGRWGAKSDPNPGNIRCWAVRTVSSDAERAHRVETAFSTTRRIVRY
jgi:hypothetical protein